MNSDELASLLQRQADRISVLIVSSDYPEIDIYIEVSKLREWCDENFPEKYGLFEMIYGRRFLRLWQQFRGEPGPLQGIISWR